MHQKRKKKILFKIRKSLTDIRLKIGWFNKEKKGEETMAIFELQPKRLVVVN